eukprot:scaffold3768_cov69-Phaeocystis_antarctica.AAC.2
METPCDVRSCQTIHEAAREIVTANNAGSSEVQGRGGGGCASVCASCQGDMTRQSDTLPFVLRVPPRLENLTEATRMPKESPALRAGDLPENSGKIVRYKVRYYTGDRSDGEEPRPICVPWRLGPG